MTTKYANLIKCFINCRLSTDYLKILLCTALEETSLNLIFNN